VASLAAASTAGFWPRSATGETSDSTLIVLLLETLNKFYVNESSF